jgi:hypothetical protein
MSTETEENYNSFMHDILAQSDAGETNQKNIFLEDFCYDLDEEGLINNHGITEYKLTAGSKSLAVDAWSFDHERSILTLIYADFRHSRSIETLTKTQIDQSYRKLRRFVKESQKKYFFEDLEDSAPVKSLVDLIRTNPITKIVLIVASNSLLSNRVNELPTDSIDGYQTAYELWDFERLFQVRNGGQIREDLHISFEKPDGGLACLPAFTGDHDIKSFLLVIPGQVLADLYFKYGERLLEQNVRTFLQFRGKVNKGIRNTINNAPHMFFSYNNGISATATEVELNEDSTKIKAVKNLQIVNGGQTTAAIFNAYKQDKADLSNIYVQVKLSVVKSEIQAELVPKISECSNTQNKVSAADFSSNHAFHLRVEELSRQIIAPQKEGSLLSTQWFYERTRGQYANAQTLLPKQSAKKTFLNKNPKSQKFTKTDLAKFILSFDQAPHEVSQGAQKAFAGYKKNTTKYLGLVGRINKHLWKSDDALNINNFWFKQTIAKAIIFKQVDNLIRNSSWYCGYKANILAYSIAKFMHLIESTEKHFNFLTIWDLQEAPDEILEFFKILTNSVQESIMSPPEGYTRNISEWAKLEDCWRIIQKLDIELPEIIQGYLIDNNELKQLNKDGKKTKKLDIQLNLESIVISKGSEYWLALKDWIQDRNLLNGLQTSILNVGCSLKENRLPSSKQAKILLDIEKLALEEGFNFVQPSEPKTRRRRSRRR